MTKEKDDNLFQTDDGMYQYPSTSVRRIVRGDTSAADKYAGEINKIIYQLNNNVSFNKLGQLKMERYLMDGTRITAIHHFGNKTVILDIPKVEEEGIEYQDVTGVMVSFQVTYVEAEDDYHGRIYFESQDTNVCPHAFIDLDAKGLYDYDNDPEPYVIRVLRDNAWIGVLVIRDEEASIYYTSPYRCIKFKLTTPVSPAVYDEWDTRYLQYDYEYEEKELSASYDLSDMGVTVQFTDPNRPLGDTPASLNVPVSLGNFSYSKLCYTDDFGPSNPCAAGCWLECGGAQFESLFGWDGFPDDAELLIDGDTLAGSYSTDWQTACYGTWGCGYGTPVCEGPCYADGTYSNVYEPLSYPTTTSTNDWDESVPGSAMASIIGLGVTKQSDFSEPDLSDVSFEVVAQVAQTYTMHSESNRLEQWTMDGCGACGGGSDSTSSVYEMDVDTDALYWVVTSENGEAWSDRQDFLGYTYMHFMTGVAHFTDQDNRLSYQVYERMAGYSDAIQDLDDNWTILFMTAFPLNSGWDSFVDDNNLYMNYDGSNTILGTLPEGTYAPRLSARGGGPSARRMFITNDEYHFYFVNDTMYSDITGTWVPSEPPMTQGNLVNSYGPVSKEIIPNKNLTYIPFADNSIPVLEGTSEYIEGKFPDKVTLEPTDYFDVADYSVRFSSYPWVNML